MSSTEQSELLDELLEGVISEADFLRLEAEMHISPEVRKAYYERLKLHTALQIEAEGGQQDGKFETTSRVVKFARISPQSLWWAGAAAAVLILLAGGFGWSLGRNGDTPADIASIEPEASGFGVVAEQSGAEWSGERAINRGDLAPGGPLKLKGGIVEIELFSGVTMIIEGEAEFEVLSSMEMSLTRGKVRAQIPELARGFRLHTASGDIVDLGTEFAVTVTEDYTDIHVLDGEIEWQPLSKPMRRLASGESLRWTATGDVAEMPQASQELTGIEDVAEQLENQRDQRRDAWHRHSFDLRKDPRLLVYYPMDQPGDWRRQLTDESSAERQGRVVRAERTTDRWDQPYAALDFSATGSRVRLNVSGEHGSLTFYCWAKIDSLDRWYNSLFLTDGHELYEPHWQIMNDGRLFFSVKRRDATKKDRDKHVAYSPSFWTPALSGKWVQIATVYDTENWTTTHYVNGEAISVDQIPENMRVETVRIGGASIGNWSEPMRGDAHFAVRNLNGAIDEFAIFSAALSAEEIAELYQIGKP